MHYRFIKIPFQEPQTKIFTLHTFDVLKGFRLTPRWKNGTGVCGEMSVANSGFYAFPQCENHKTICSSRFNFELKLSFSGPGEARIMKKTE